MAKKTTSDFVVPETFAPFVEIVGDRVRFNFSVPRVQVVPVKPKAGAAPSEVDNAHVAGSAILEFAWFYFLKQYLNDGAKTQWTERVKDGDDIVHRLTPDEVREDAEANAERKRAALYGDREIGSTGDFVPEEVNQLRTLVRGWVLKNARTEDGQRYAIASSKNRTAIPSAIVKGLAFDEILGSAIALGMTEKKAKAIEKLAHANAAILADDSDMEVDV